MKEYNIFSELIPVNYNSNMTESETKDFVTDGEGNYYKIPDKGHTKLISIEDSQLSHYKFRYNWTTKEIEIFVYNEKDSIDVNAYDFLDSVELNPYDFIDNPEYWYKLVAAEYDDFFESEVNDIIAAEAVTNINYVAGENVYHREPETRFTYTAYFDINVNEGEFDSSTSRIKEEVLPQIADKLNEYFKYSIDEPSFYDAKFDYPVFAEVSVEGDYLVITLKTDMDEDIDELMRIINHEYLDIKYIIKGITKFDETEDYIYDCVKIVKTEN